MMNRDDSLDPLAARLRREALAERPVFSSELHEQILERISQTSAAPQRAQISRRWLMPAAVAAAILVGLSLIHSRPAAPTNPPLEIAKNLPDAPAMPNFSMDSSVDLAGVVSAKLWPPEVAVSLPSTDATPPAPVAEAPADSSNSLLAAFQNPTQSATSAVVDAMPPSVRTLIAIASASR
jgi:hypothetical protein